MTNFDPLQRLHHSASLCPFLLQENVHEFEQYNKQSKEPQITKLSLNSYELQNFTSKSWK